MSQAYEWLSHVSLFMFKVDETYYKDEAKVW